MAAPSRRRISDIPIATIAGVDSVDGIQAILRSHDFGYFQRSAQLADAMLRDDRISGVLETRVGALTSSPLEVKAGNDSAKAGRIAEMIGGSDEEPGLWDAMFPKSAVSMLSLYGNFLGVAVAEIIWSTTSEWEIWQQLAPGVALNSPGSKKLAWVPRIKVWHPQFVYFDWATMRFVISTRDGIIPLPTPDEQPQGDGKWFVWTPFGYQYGWLRALIRSLADKYLYRGWNYRDWARYNERHGLPILAVQTPEEAEKEVKEKFMAKLATLGSDAVVQLPQIDGENKYDLKLVEAQAKTHESFVQFKKELDVDIAVDVLGQNLTTEGGTDGGSRALGQVQNLIRIDKAILDAGIADALRLQVLTHFTVYNYGDASLTPQPKYCVEPPDDEQKEALALKTAGEALGALKTAGAPIDDRAILDRMGVPMLTPEEVEARKAVEMEEAAARAEAMGLPAKGEGGDEGGNGENPEGGDGGGKGGGPPSGGGKKKPQTALSSFRSPLPGAVKRYTFAGLPIAVENPAGSLRVWTEDGPNGKVIGSTTMRHDYGFIDGHLGWDDEELDCYVGPVPEPSHVYVVHQKAKPDYKKYDEDKVFLGFQSADAARDAYVAHRNDGDKAIGSMSVIPLDEFKRKLKRRTGTGKIRATAGMQAATLEAIVALSARAEASAALKAKPSRSVTGRKRARFYAERVADNAKVLAARALAVDLAGMKEDIDAATDFDDLRRRLVDRYKSMDPKRMARIVEKARIMANLGGRLSVLKEI